MWGPVDRAWPCLVLNLSVAVVSGSPLSLSDHAGRGSSSNDDATKHVELWWWGQGREGMYHWAGGCPQPPGWTVGIYPQVREVLGLLSDGVSRLNR